MLIKELNFYLQQFESTPPSTKIISQSSPTFSNYIKWIANKTISTSNSFSSSRPDNFHNFMLEPKRSIPSKDCNVSRAKLSKMGNSSIAIASVFSTENTPDVNFKAQTMTDIFHKGIVSNKHITSRICMPEITSEATKSTYNLSELPHTTLSFNMHNKKQRETIDVQQRPLRGAPPCSADKTIAINADYESISRVNRVRFSDKQESSHSEPQKSIVSHLYAGQDF